MKNKTKNIDELYQILIFLGFKFIEYKNNITSNGHETATTNKDIYDFFGKEIMTSGQFLQDIKWFNFQKDWNDLMFLVEKIEKSQFVDEFEIKKCYIYGNIVKITPSTKETFNLFENISKDITKIEAVYNTCIEFIKWYNNNN